MVRLKATEVRTVRRLKEAGTSNREVARRLGVSETAVRKLLQRMDWKSTPDCVQPALPGLLPERVEPSPEPDPAGPYPPSQTELPEPWAMAPPRPWPW